MTIVRTLIRTFIKICLLKIFLVPFLFVMGIVASSADVLGPFSVGDFNGRVDAVARTGETIKAATEDLAVFEIDLLRRLIEKAKKINTDDTIARLHRIRLWAESSI